MGRMAVQLYTEAEQLERADDRGARIVALDIQEREAILRVLEDCSDGLPGAARHAGPGTRVAPARRPLTPLRGYTGSKRSSFALTAPGHRAGRAIGGRA
jgi:hypothetical protein